MKAFTRTNLLLLTAVIALTGAPLALGLGRGKAGPVVGADDRAEQQIIADHPGFQPWFRSLVEPPSGEVESALFALQAGLGAGFIGYYFGAARTRRRLTAAAPDAPAAEAAAPASPNTDSRAG